MKNNFLKIIFIFKFFFFREGAGSTQLDELRRSVSLVFVFIYILFDIFVGLLLRIVIANRYRD